MSERSSEVLAAIPCKSGRVEHDELGQLRDLPIPRSRVSDEVDRVVERRQRKLRCRRMKWFASI